MTAMDAFEHGLWNSQCPVSALGARAFVTDHKDTRFVFKQLADDLWAQAPHFADFGDGIVGLDTPSACIGRHISYTVLWWCWRDSAEILKQKRGVFSLPVATPEVGRLNYSL
jgi:hypothetical protein